MNYQADRLYDLLPVIYRLRDAEQGYPLRALLQVIAGQVNLVEADINQLYENWFIETCQEWVVPYIGDLIGYRPVHEAGEPGDVNTPQGQLRNKILIPRREVANTIRYRRRKGTLALLEQLANDVAGWPARAVEFYRLLGWMQAVNHVRPGYGRTADLRQGQSLNWIDTPFDELAHTVDVRRINSRYSQGRYNIPHVGLFIWRLKSYSVSNTPAYCLEEVGPRCYTFSVLGNDTPLYNRPQPEPEPSRIADILNLPVPVQRRAFEKEILVDGRVERRQASADYYGVEKSLAIWAPDWPKKGATQPIPLEQIIPADLTDWYYRAPRNHIAVDPELGRIIFPGGQLPKQGVWVAYRYGFSGDMGGGEYERTLSQAANSDLYLVKGQEELKKALLPWQDKDFYDKQPAQAVIEIIDSGVYTLPINICLKAQHTLQLRAANHTRPVIRLLDYMAERPDSFTVAGAAGSQFVLDGLLITGRSLKIQGPETDPEEPESTPGEDVCQVTIRHCTLVPGWTLQNDCEPRRPSEPSLELSNTKARVAIEYTILGSIQVVADQVNRAPMIIHISDTILDATGSDCDSPACLALSSADWTLAHAVLTINRSTVFGHVHTHAIELAENSIFMGLVKVGRRQRGCMRFCYVTPISRTPRRYNCQPDLVELAAETEYSPGAERDQAKERERLRVWPQFNSQRYGTPTYAQLAHTCAPEITRGADDESEMGAFHNLYQPQRAANLAARLEEYTPAGMTAGILFAS